LSDIDDSEFLMTHDDIPDEHDGGLTTQLAKTSFMSVRSPPQISGLLY
jgi:hypothetical protein